MKSISNFFANLRRKKQQKQYAEAHRDTIRSTYLLDKTTPFAVREAFRNLKASISVAIPKKEGNGISLLCTSTFPRRGKNHRHGQPRIDVRHIESKSSAARRRYQKGPRFQIFRRSS